MGGFFTKKSLKAGIDLTISTVKPGILKNLPVKVGFSVKTRR